MNKNKYRLKDAEHYTTEMAKPIEDKLWFLDHVYVESMIDIGTADAYIPIYLSTMFDHKFKCYAYEPNYNLHWRGFIAANSENQPKSHKKRVMLYNDYREFLNIVKSKKQLNLVLLSSVLHEVYNAISDEKARFFRLIKESGARYIAIRDMKPNVPIGAFMDLRVDIPPYLLDKWEEYINSPYHHGDINSYSYSQFLLKHRYNVNWEHELKEDYFATNWDQIDMILNVLGYKKEYEKHYTPDFIQQDIEKTFNFNLQEEGYSTHAKILYRFN